MTGKFLKRKLLKAKKWIVERSYYIRRAYNRKKIVRKDFTIISNNCWAGKVYQYLDMPYLSPTVGLYFFAEDYLKFIENLEYYLGCELQFISVEESKYTSILKEKKQTNVPIGILGDVEIVFLHYTSKEEAKEKWDRRKGRVNYENLIFKFSKMNSCTEEDMARFDNMPFDRKILLNNRKRTLYSSEVYWNGEGNDTEIFSDTLPFPGNLCLTKILCKKEVT